MSRSTDYVVPDDLPSFAPRAANKRIQGGGNALVLAGAAAVASAAAVPSPACAPKTVSEQCPCSYAACPNKVSGKCKYELMTIHVSKAGKKSLWDCPSCTEHGCHKLQAKEKKKLEEVVKIATSNFIDAKIAAVMSSGGLTNRQRALLQGFSFPKPRRRN